MFQVLESNTNDSILYETTHMAGLFDWLIVQWYEHSYFFSIPAVWAFHMLYKK